MSERDTQFAGFAKLLWEELLGLFGRGYIDVVHDGMDDEWNAEYSQAIARRAYAFACHVATQTLLVAHGDMSKVPDLIEWPEVAGNE